MKTTFRQPPLLCPVRSTSGEAVEVSIAASKWDKNTPWNDDVSSCDAGIPPWEES